MATPPYVHSHPGSRHGSPALSQWSVDAYPGQQPGNLVYGQYGSPMSVHNQPMQYGSPPVPGMIRDSTSPPTSSHSHDGSMTGARPRRSTPTRRRNRNNAIKAEIPELTAPLSELTKDMNDIPLRDMDDWVHRPVEKRREEVAKRDGTIARPMNSFMLYRSAYADRTKHWGEQNNHQVVSTVCGRSWNMEPPEIREKYNELARIERDNHQKAHPGYKFTPSKTNNTTQSPRKRRDPVNDDAGEGLTLLASDDDADPDYQPSGSTKRRCKPPPAAAVSMVNHTSSPEAGMYAPYGYGGGMGPFPALTHGRLPFYSSSPPSSHTSSSSPSSSSSSSALFLSSSHFNAANPGMTAPEPLLEHGYGGYYQMREHPGPLGLGDNVNDVHFVRTVHPAFDQGHHHLQVLHHQNHHQHHQQQQQHSVVGLPGTGHLDLFDEQINGLPTTSAPFDHSQLDPVLLGPGFGPPFDGPLHDSTTFSEAGFRAFDNDVLNASLNPAVPFSADEGQMWPRSEVEAEFAQIPRDELP